MTFCCTLRHGVIGGRLSIFGLSTLFSVRVQIVPIDSASLMIARQDSDIAKKAERQVSTESTVSNKRYGWLNLPRQLITHNSICREFLSKEFNRKEFFLLRTLRMFLTDCVEVVVSSLLDGLFAQVET